MDEPKPTLRLNKYLSEAGACSRREADRLIEAGRVRIDGVVASLGAQVPPGARVELDGRAIDAPRPDAHVYLAYHKPAGIICTTDPRAPDNIVSAVAHPRRVFPVGRLDVASEGLIFLTSDGDVVNKILRAGNAHEKTYDVTVDRAVDAVFLRRMAEGVPILDTVTLPCRITRTGARRFTLVLTQGLNRQIRRMCDALGYGVVRLVRTRIMHVTLGELPRGRWRELTVAERTELHRLVATSSKTAFAGETSGGGDADDD
ncbi:pseudouridine synthase [Myxococcota bacterium]|nr:pseudouridine synthase [Myxococcota bacterium]